MPTDESKKDPKNPGEKPDPKNESGTSTPSTADEYAAAIKELKDKTVSREEYEKLRGEHKALTKALAEGKKPEVVEVDTSTEKTTDELKAFILKNKDMSNLDYVKNALELRERMLKSGKPDPFAPNSRLRPTTEQELANAKKVADILQECVDASNGDSRVFNTELQRRMR